MSESFWSLVTQLCVRLAGIGESNSNNGAMTVPVQKLRNFAFSILLKQGSASEHGAGQRWEMRVEDRILAKVYQMQRQSRHREALQLRACLNRLRSLNGRCTVEVQACLEFLLHLADTGPKPPRTRRRLFELPPLALPGEEVPQPVCLVPGVPAFSEYPRELFENLDDDLDNAAVVRSSTFLPSICQAEPGFDLNGNPLFRSCLSSLTAEELSKGDRRGALSLRDPLPRIPRLTALTRSSRSLKLRAESQRQASQCQASDALASEDGRCNKRQGMVPLPLWDDEDWKYAVESQSRQYYTWETLGSNAGRKEKPFLTEAGPGPAEAICRSRAWQLSLLGQNGSAATGPERHSVYMEQQALVQQILYVMVGVPSECFRYDTVLGHFVPTEGTRLMGTSSEALAPVLSEFARCGTDIRFLEDLSCRSAEGGTRRSLTLEAFQGGLKRYLHLCHGLLLPMTEHVGTLTVRQLDHLTSSLRDQIRVVADFCRLELGDGTDKRHGMQLLSRLQNRVETSWGQNGYATLMFLLQCSCQPYLRFLRCWLFDGKCNDPFGEFPLQLNHREMESRDVTFWEKGFALRFSDDPAEEAAPFLADILQDILECAKAAMLLKICKPQTPLLWSDKPRPAVTLAFSMAKLVEIRTSSEHYFQELKAAMEDLPALRLGQAPDITFPDDWTRVRESRAQVEDRRLYAIPRSPSSSASRDLVASSLSSFTKLAEGSRRAVVTGTSEDASAPQDGVLYSATSRTHMRVTGRSGGRQNEESELASRGLYCDETRTYMKPACRNVFGHASDSQLRNILYPDLNQNFGRKPAGNGASPVARPAELEPDVSQGVDLLVNVDQGLSNQGAEMVLGTVSNSDDVDGGDARGTAERLDKDVLRASVVETGEERDVTAVHQVEHVEESEYNGDRSDDENCGSTSKKNKSYQEGDSKAVGHGLASQETLHPFTLQGGDGDGTRQAEHSKWPQYKAVPYRTSFPEIYEEPLTSNLLRLSGDKGDEDMLDWCSSSGCGLLPLDVAIKRSLLPPLTAQMRLIDRACVSLMVCELHLYDHLEALANYFCFQDGEFGQALCDSLCHLMRRPLRAPSDLLNTSTLNGVLGDALASSLHGDSPEAANLSLDAKRIPSVVLPGQNILGCLVLSYKVEWPLNIIITAPCLQRYNKVFGFLLSIRRALWALSDISGRLKPSALPCKPDPWPQFRQLQLMRHEMQHFVQLVQSYVGGQVMQTSLAELHADLDGRTRNVDDLRAVHLRFLKRLSQRLLLARRAAPVSKLLRESLKTVLLFQEELASQGWQVDAHSGELRHPAFARLSRAHTRFQGAVHLLRTTLKGWETFQCRPSSFKLSVVLDFSAFLWPDSLAPGAADQDASGGSATSKLYMLTDSSATSVL